jgi:large subunit ribosomal protein L24
MKQKFSTKWIASKQPRKQRKYRYNLPLHLRHKLLSANLSKDLRKKYSRRSFPLRKSDTVKIMRGKFKKKTGKVSIVNLSKLKVAIEGVQVQKKDGTKVNIYFDPSNLQIIELNLEDTERTKSLGRKNAPEKKS